MVTMKYQAFKVEFDHLEVRLNEQAALGWSVLTCQIRLPSKQGTTGYPHAFVVMEKHNEAVVEEPQPGDEQGAMPMKG